MVLPDMKRLMSNGITWHVMVLPDMKRLMSNGITWHETAYE